MRILTYERAISPNDFTVTHWWSYIDLKKESHELPYGMHINPYSKLKAHGTFYDWYLRDFPSGVLSDYIHALGVESQCKHVS